MDTSALDLRFRLGSIPVTVTPLFWLATLVLGANNLRGPRIVLWLAIVFVSVLVHELGHALAAIAFGSRARINLHSFGGTTEHQPLPRWRQIAVTLAGPGAGFVLGGLVLGVYTLTSLSLSSTAHWVVGSLIWVNIAWGVFNLLPVPPLDGGHVMVDLAGRKHARTAHIVGVVVAVLVALAAFKMGQAYTALLFGFLAFRNVQVVQALGRH